MAGKGKKQGNRHATPNSARGMMGHMGVKSSAFAPTDSKLISQYMVVDHMTAHYRNLSKVKPVVDNKTPKAWITSQKAKDKARRKALNEEQIRRNQWLAGSMSSRPPTRDSERDRDDMIAMMESFSALDDDMDEVDGVHNISSSVSTRKANRLDEDDLNFVNNMVSDNVKSPSRYHSQKVMKTNIPNNKNKPYSKPRTQQHRDSSRQASPANSPARQNRTGSSSDLIEKRSHKFTEPEKPFTPRTLKSKNEVQSRLASFKYYTAPKKSAREPPVPAARSSMRPGTASRADTVYSDSVDLMNETLMSRDHAPNDAPMGVPPLDISLDADNMKWMKEHAQRGWLKEQSRKAHLRASAGARSDAGSEAGSARYEPPPTMKGSMHNKTLNGTQNLTREEELRYLEFITEVTNDVLDRGIYTNRVLMQVFDAHIEKRKHDLKPQKMYEMLNDLRQDLGIPNDTDYEDLGARSIHSPPDYHGTDDSHYTGQVPDPRAARRKQQMNSSGDDYSTAQRGNLPNLRGGRRRINSGEGRPPLPRPGSRGSRSRPGSSCSNLQEVKEEAEDTSLTFTFSDTPTSSGKANILKVEHEDEEVPGLGLEGSDGSRDGPMSMSMSNEDTGDALDHPVVFAEQEAVSHSAPREKQSRHEENGLLENGDEHKHFDEPANDYDSYEDSRHQQTDSHFSADERNTFSEPGEEDDERHEMQNGQEYDDDENDLNAMYTNAINGTLEGDDENLDYDDDTFHEDDRDTLKDAEVKTPKTPPKPTPRSRKMLASSDFTPRSTEHTQTTTESVTVSELGTEDDDQF